MSICSVVVLFLLANLPQSEGYISHGFYDFLKLRFGKEYANNVARYDYGPLGSFGGGMHRAGTKTNKTPVVFVAGWLSTASFSWPAVTTWLMHGYTMEELYSTSYGIPVLGVASIHWGLECHYVNATRTMIKAVAEFTNSTVNVIAYSMGGPVSRKAILGGKCVDTQEDLGPPLTHLVNVYLGVGGANNGALGCLVPAPGVCSLNNGMFCLSSYIRDINSVKRYEGKTIYVLQSSTDELVGYWLCGKHAADIEGSNRTVTLFGFEHLALCTITPFQQYNLIHKGSLL
ncbi:hypothetical protein M3Y94_01216200 [Aphelenchoides besseyi]|nr:hypothetical protein M3Y94_01216200 [Aphelenchoides besseyi]